MRERTEILLEYLESHVEVTRTPKPNDATRVFGHFDIIVIKPPEATEFTKLVAAAYPESHASSRASLFSSKGLDYYQLAVWLNIDQNRDRADMNAIRVSFLAERFGFVSFSDDAKIIPVSEDAPDVFRVPSSPVLMNNQAFHSSPEQVAAYHEALGIKTFKFRKRYYKVPQALNNLVNLLQTIQDRGKRPPGMPSP